MSAEGLSPLVCYFERLGDDGGGRFICSWCQPESRDYLEVVPFAFWPSICDVCGRWLPVPEVPVFSPVPVPVPVSSRRGVIDPVYVYEVPMGDGLPWSACDECAPDGVRDGVRLLPYDRDHLPLGCEFCGVWFRGSSLLAKRSPAPAPVIGSIFVAIGRRPVWASGTFGDGWGATEWERFRSAVSEVVAHYSFDSSADRNDFEGVRRVYEFVSVRPVPDLFGGVEDSALFVAFDSFTDSNLRPALARLGAYWGQDSIALTTPAGVEFIKGDSLADFERDGFFFDLVERHAR